MLAWTYQHKGRISKFIVFLALISAMLFVGISCNVSDESEKGDSSSISFDLKFPDKSSSSAGYTTQSLNTGDGIDCSARGISTIDCNVYQNGNVEAGEEFACEKHKGIINNVPSGSVELEILAKDDNGKTKYEGKKSSIHVSDGETKKVGEVVLTHSYSVNIEKPSGGSTFSYADTIEFQGSGNDPEDGNLSGSNLIWSSDLDGELGTGEVVSSSLSSGNHTITLTGSDSKDKEFKASISLDVKQNQPPKADAGGNQTVTSDDSVTLDGTNSSDDVGIDTYEWSKVSGTGGGLNDKDQAQATFSPSAEENSTSDYVFELTVTDEQGLTDSGNTTVSVYPGHFEANMTFSSINSTGDKVILNLHEEDAPPLNATIDWGDGNSNNSQGLSAGNYTFVHEYADTELYQVNSTVDNSLGQSDSKIWNTQLDAEVSAQTKPNSTHTYLDIIRVGNLTEQDNPPFDIEIDWGDGNSNNSTGLSAGNYTFEHTYANASKYHLVNATIINDIGQNASYNILISRLPDTNQTTCYDNSTSLSNCSSPDEDFYGQDATYSINSPSYTKLDANGNELSDDATVQDGLAMVRDEVTGLVWEVKTTNSSSIHYNEFKTTWYNATDNSTSGFIGKLNTNSFGGHSDWRMPTLKELTSIVDYGTYDPAIDTNFYPNTMASGYWSSTTIASNDVDNAWRVDFDHGNDGEYNKSNDYYVRAVRSGQ